MYKAARISLMKVKEAQSETMHTAEDFAKECRDISDLAQESVHVLTLNQRHMIIDRHMVSLGTATEALVHPREVFRPVIIDGATAFVLIHNHPSGVVKPSPEDIRLKDRMKKAAELLGIRFLDMIIVSHGGNYWSAVDDNQM